MIVALVAVKEASGVPPMIPAKRSVPVPPSTIKELPPLSELISVDEKVMLLLFDVIVLLPIKLTGSEKTRGFPPETVMLFPISIKLALEKMRFVGGVTPPTALLKITIPVPAAVVRA